MKDPRRASARLLATLTLAAFAAALPLKHAAQSAPSQAPSPNGKIVYQSDQAGDPGVNDIYTMDADGRHETRLTNNAADDAQPVWSPQGDRIAFVSDRRDGYEIFLMNADGSNQRPLRADGPVRAFDAVWSPDGKHLAYTSGGDAYVVEAVAPGGGDSTAAPSNVSALKAAGSKDIEVAWSPAGGQLVVRNTTDCGGCSDLYVMNADGTGRTQLTSTPGFEANARWSPAGGQIAYEADRGGRGFYVVNADGTNDHLVSGAVGGFGDVAWSPDGARLAFRSLTGSNVYAVGADGSGLVPLSDVPSTGGDIFWSPDGSKVAFHSSGGGSYVDIYVVAADGSARRALNYTKTRRADEFAYSWQKVTP